MAVLPNNYVNIHIPSNSEMNEYILSQLQQWADKLNCAVVPISHKLDEGGVPTYSKQDIINYIKIMNTDDLLDLKRKVDKELSTREIKLL